jgi:hypothetical protein
VNGTTEVWLGDFVRGLLHSVTVRFCEKVFLQTMMSRVTLLVFSVLFFPSFASSVRILEHLFGQGLSSLQSESAPQLAACVINDECAALCSNVSNSEINWTLPQQIESLSSICVVPPSASHVALCVDGMGKTDELVDSWLLDASQVNGSVGQFETVRSRRSPSGGFVWCLARSSNNNDVHVTISVVALETPSNLIAVLMPSFDFRKSHVSVLSDAARSQTPVTLDTPCSFLNDTSSPLLRFGCENPNTIVILLIAFLCGIVVVGVIFFAVRLFRRAYVNVITIGSTSDSAIDQLALWLGLHVTATRGLFEVTSTMSASGSESGTIVLYAVVGRVMDSETLALQLTRAVAHMSVRERNRTVCIVVNDSSGSSCRALVSRLKQEKIGAVVEVADGDSSVVLNAAKREILGIVC